MQPTPSTPFLKPLSITIIALVVLTIVSVSFVTTRYTSRFLPNTRIDTIDISHLTFPEALAKLHSESQPIPNTTLTVQHEDQQWATSSASLGLHRTTAATLEQVFAESHPNSLPHLFVYLIQSLFEKNDAFSQLAYEEDRVTTFIRTLQPEVDIQGTTPSARLAVAGAPSSIAIEPGAHGRALLIEESTEALLLAAHDQDYSVPLATATTSTVLTEAEQVAFRDRATQLVGKSVRLESEYGSVVLPDTQLVSLLSFPSGLQSTVLTEIFTEWQSRFGTQAQSAVFSYNPETLAVSEFVPDRPHITLDESATTRALTEHLENLLAPSIDTNTSENTQTSSSSILPLSLHTTAAPQTLGQTNDLGIRERIAFGESEYAHSIPSRVHNVARTSEIINNTIVPPGVEFSFNKALGEVSRRTGFQPAYIIRNGKTELGDGGGVCQVSTTLFRALLDGGIEVTKRLPHSYRVSYYELNAKPGLDATVYAGEVDLRFRNDTDNHILIHTTVDSENLYMTVELYGTSDGRTAEITEHKVWGASPPLPTQFIPDPTLAPGQRKQIDWAVGGVKSAFTTVVKDKDGNIIREVTYNSNYRPWAAKYLVGVTQ